MEHLSTRPLLGKFAICVGNGGLCNSVCMNEIADSAYYLQDFDNKQI